VLGDKSLNAIEFLLETGGEIVCAVFEKDHETKCEEDKQNDPEQPAQERHARKGS